MCKWGTVTEMEIKIPAHLSRTGKERMKKVGVDSCIATLVKALNAAGMVTEASCCGHGKQPGSIILEGNKELRIMTFEQGRKVDKLFPPINP